MAYVYQFYVSSEGREALYAEMLGRGFVSLKATIQAALLGASEEQIVRGIELGKRLQFMRYGDEERQSR